MWLLVMFDLPVVQPEERKLAHDFRETLLKLGFEMSQFSVYLRFCTSQSQVDTLCRRVEAVLPPAGRVHLLQVTDKQYERTITYTGRRRNAPIKAPDQFLLF